MHLFSFILTGIHKQLLKSMEYQGYRVLVTGATRGIGQAIADAFHQRGAHVCASGRNVDMLQAQKEQYGGERFSIWPLDLSHPESVSDVVKEIDHAEGPIDILVNNGGMVKDALSVRMRDEMWSQVITVDLTSPFILAREALKGMVRKKWGRIINIASLVGITGNPGQANYAAAKAGMIWWSRCMAKEVARWGITVNCIAPGYIQTSMTEGLPIDLKSIPVGRLGNPQEIVHGVLYLASPQASYVTGEVLNINGGLLCP